MNNHIVLLTVITLTYIIFFYDILSLYKHITTQKKYIRDKHVFFFI